MRRTGLRRALSVAALVLLGLSASYGAVINGTFETGNFNGWVTTAGATVTGISCGTGATPDTGSFMAEICSNDLNASGMDAFFGLAPGTVAGLNPDASMGGGIYQMVTVPANGLVEFRYFWDFLDWGFNDFAFAVIDGQTFVLGPPGGPGSIGWTTFSTNVVAGGTILIGFGAMNGGNATTPGDTDVFSALLIDNV